MSTLLSTRLAAGTTFVLAGVARPVTASAAEPPQAAYLRAEDAPGDGLPALVDVVSGGAYRRVVGDDTLHGAKDIGAFDLRARALLGRTVAYCVGVDGEVGASERGFVGSATGWFTGVGLRFGESGAIALCGGVGVSGMHNALVTAGDIPAELSVGSDLGPLRASLWARPKWVFGGDAAARRHGTFIHAVDELDVGLDVRLARQHRYWSTTSGGGGLALGLQYGELMGTRTLGLTLGFDFTGAK